MDLPLEKVNKITSASLTIEILKFLTYGVHLLVMMNEVFPVGASNNVFTWWKSSPAHVL